MFKALSGSRTYIVSVLIVIVSLIQGFAAITGVVVPGVEANTNWLQSLTGASDSILTALMGAGLGFLRSGVDKLK